MPMVSRGFQDRISPSTNRGVAKVEPMFTTGTAADRRFRGA